MSWLFAKFHRRLFNGYRGVPVPSNHHKYILRKENTLNWKWHTCIHIEITTNSEIIISIVVLRTFWQSFVIWFLISALSKFFPCFIFSESISTIHNVGFSYFYLSTKQRVLIFFLPHYRICHFCKTYVKLFWLNHYFGYKKNCHCFLILNPDNVLFSHFYGKIRFYWCIMDS